jgi:DNA-binding response OmpR family regulator
VTTIVVIEDDPDLADLLRATLGGVGFACSVATTGREGVARVRAVQPDAVLLDLDLPDADGLDLVPDLREVAPVIVLTGRRTEESLVTGLGRGAEDYITKPFSPRVLLARLDVVLRRRGERPTSIEHGPLMIDLGRRTATLAGVPVDLTRRELDLLAFLAARPGVVVPRDDILTAGWHSSSEWQTAATVTEHVRRIRIKLGDPAWIESVRGIGYRFTPPAT